jgi:transcriptional regulator with XRE-family HTH domain
MAARAKANSNAVAKAGARAGPKSVARAGRTLPAAPQAGARGKAGSVVKNAAVGPAKAASKAAEPKRDDLQIGGRLKHARLLAGILMRELATKVGCTESMISKIESGRVVPSLPMLQRLVEALDRDLASFFGSDPNSPGMILRAGQRLVAHTDPIRQGSRVSYERLVPFGAGNLLEGNIHVVEPDGAKHDPITHQGETLGYVIEGQLELTIESTLYTLGPGDSFFFKNHLTNSYRNTGSSLARVIWVNTPQVH